MTEQKRPALNLRYYNGEIEDGDAVDEDTVSGFCAGDGKGGGE